MRSLVELAARPEFSVAVVTCDDDHRDWSPPEEADRHLIVLVRRGRFRRSVAGRDVDLDPTTAYLAVPGQEVRFAHPTGGDVCTSVRLAPSLWRTLADGLPDPAASAVYVDARVDLTHRRLLASAASGDVDYALAAGLLDLLALTVRQVADRPAAAGARARDTDRALVSAAREAIAADHPAAGGLLPLAELLHVSPYRLSRAFPRELGVSLTHYRNRVRVARALDRVEAGEGDLGAVAADLGFADQAHLCRTVVRHVGQTPSALRRLLVS